VPLAGVMVMEFADTALIVPLTMNGASINNICVARLLPLLVILAITLYPTLILENWVVMLKLPNQPRLSPRLVAILALLRSVGIDIEAYLVFWST